MKTKYRELILQNIHSYIDDLNREDFSHDSSHIFRVENLAKKIAEQENADIEIIEASCLLFDIARGLEDKGEVEDHAQKAVEIAQDILPRINFPDKKIEAVCHTIISHRRSKDRTPETIEAKILRDADYLDAMGATTIARIFASTFQSKKYARPVYVDEPYDEKTAEYKSAIHFLLYLTKHPKHQPDSFFTKEGKRMAAERAVIMKEFAETFIAEWHGDK